MKKSSKKIESMNEDEIATTTTTQVAPQAEGTTKTKQIGKGGGTKEANSLFDLESEKDEVAEFRGNAIKESLPNYEAQMREDQANLETLRVRIVSRQGLGIDKDDADGEDLYVFDQNRRNGRRKMPNGQSTYKLVASCKEIGVDEKQCRRLADRWALILKFRAMGVVEPRLGVSHYDAIKCLASVEAKLEALRDAEINGLSVAALREKYIEAKEPVQMGWKERLCSLAEEASKELRIIHGLMMEQGGSPDEDVLSWIDDIVVAANYFTPAAKEVA